jgi:hypothetical protein
MQRLLLYFTILTVILSTAGTASAYMEYSFRGKVQSGSGYKMGSGYASPLFVVGDTVNITISFDHNTNQVLALDFTAGSYHHRMDSFSGYSVASGPVFDYNSGTGVMNRADVRFNETQDNYPYWFIKYVNGGSSQDHWFVFNTYTNNDTVNGFSLNTFSYSTADYLTFTGAQQVVPIPAAVWLLGSGLIGIVGLRNRFSS